MKKQILVTFDYELFLGSNSGSVKKCLIEPTDLILSVLKKYELHSIFFVDLTYLFRLKEVSERNLFAKSDYDQIISQLKNILNNKGRVFYHLHPHWLDAIYLYETNTWDLSNKSKFSLNNLSPEQLELVFNKSNKVIEEIYENQIPDELGFRAGGLYIQPFYLLKELFKRYNIKYDFSVLRGAKSLQQGYQFDFSVYPNNYSYSFEEDVLLEDNKGTFVEFSMNQFTLKGWNKILNGIIYRLNKKRQFCQRIGDGSSSGNQIHGEQLQQNKLNVDETFSIELLNFYKAKLYYQSLKKTNYLHLISHPKLCSIDSINSFDLFIKKSKNKFNIISDFKQFI